MNEMSKDILNSQSAEKFVPQGIAARRQLFVCHRFLHAWGVLPIIALHVIVEHGALRFGTLLRTRSAVAETAIERG